MTPEEADMLRELEQTASAPTPKAAKNPPGFLMWDWLVKVIEYNTAMIFGDTGSGKTKTCMQIAFECAKEGRKVKYIDHEANLSQQDIKTLTDVGVVYKLIPDYTALYNLKKDDLRGFDLMIIDSATLAITGRWAKLDMHSKGQILQMLQGMVYSLSQECITNRKSIVIMTAQPISVMGDRKNLSPVGDKTMYMTKEIYYIAAPRDEHGRVVSRNIVAYRSRSFDDGTIITKIKTQKFGVLMDKTIMANLLKEL